MALETDALLERRRLRRRLAWWRTGAILLAVALVVAVAGRIVQPGSFVARIAITGVIVEDRERDRLIDRIARDGRAKALIVHINSPGGTVVGGERLYKALRAAAKRKPVVAVMGSLATSAGYMTAIGADYIAANEGTITGSVGVILQATDVTGLLEKLGIKTDAIKSAPLKGVPSPLEPLTPEAREATRAMVLDIYQMFLDLVRERRKLSDDALAQVRDGRVFTGRQALKLGLIDSVGGEDAARDWLATKRGVARSVRIRIYEREDAFSPWRMVDAMLGQKTVFSERLTLDGLISLWHPDAR